MPEQVKIVLLGATPADREWLNSISRSLGASPRTYEGGLIYQIVKVCRVSGRSRWLRRLTEIAAPWVDAVMIAVRSRGGDILLLRSVRTAVIYLWLIEPMLTCRRPVVVTWFTLKARPPSRWRAIYRRALRRAAAVVVYSPTEPAQYADWFGVPPTTFHLMTLEAPTLREMPPRQPRKEVDVFMGGETNRDWTTFGAVCRRMPSTSFVAVAPSDHLHSLPDLTNLRKISEVPFDSYCSTLSRARVQLILVRDRGVAVGQRDLLLGGVLSMPVVATAVEPLQIYDRDAKAVTYVPEGDVGQICDAITAALRCEATRQDRGASLHRIVQERHTPQAVAPHWARLLKQKCLVP